MITKQNFKKGVDIIYYEDSTKVTNSYLLNDTEIEKVANEIAYSRGCKYDWKCLYLRNEKSYISEIKAHNRLFSLGLWKSHTIDTDLEEDISKVKEIIWRIIGK